MRLRSERGSLPGNTARVLVVLGAMIAASAAIAGATRVQTPRPRTFVVSRLQADEIAAVVGFIRAYNRRDLKAALGYLESKKAAHGQDTTAATDCDYRRQTAKIYVFRSGFARWLRQRFADHDRLILAQILDQNPAQPVGVVGVKFARRRSDTLRKLGFPNGIVPQITMKLPLHFEKGLVKFPFFALASRAPAGPNPDCKLVAAP
jgi:hypothetical protein